MAQLIPRLELKGLSARLRIAFYAAEKHYLRQPVRLPVPEAGSEWLRVSLADVPVALARCGLKLNRYRIGNADGFRPDECRFRFQFSRSEERLDYGSYDLFNNACTHNSWDMQIKILQDPAGPIVLLTLVDPREPQPGMMLMQIQP